jgi:hypothetical protein
MNRPSRSTIESILRGNMRIVAWAIALVLIADVFVAFRHVTPAPANLAGPNGQNNSGAPGTPGGVSSSPTSGASPSASPSAKETSGGLPSDAKGHLPKAGTFIPGFGTVPFGVTNTTIQVDYYWKGDRTMTSPFLGHTGQKGAVDEADSFRNFVAYVNKHANGDATLMGFKFNLHGRKLVPYVYDAGQYPETYGQTAADIKNKPPFVAISSHGGLSDYVCDYLYKAKIFNISTYDLGRYPGGLYKGTNGYCLPQGLAWEKQLELSVSYIAHQSKTTKYQSTTGRVKRIYGILYADYPGLRDSVAVLKQKLKEAGVDVAVDYRVSTDLTSAAQEDPGAIAAFRKKNVNTLIAPDSGSPITFTHAAQGSGYSPDYYVWPCSGEDAVGQVRLYDPNQWARAEGLSCYDANWNLDLTLDDNARSTQWYHQYQEMAGKKDPPASSPLVYQSFLPMLAGITYAGRELSVERFRAGMMAFKYGNGLTRYDAINGATNKLSHFLVALGSPDGSQIGDCAHVSWSNANHTSGNASTGNYVYSDERYRPGFIF